MQSTTSALDLKGLFDAPSKNLELAFEHVIGLITQQSRDVDELKQAQVKAAETNEELRSKLERSADELTRERDETAAELQKLRNDYHDLLTDHQQSEATVGNLQQEIKVEQETYAVGYLTYMLGFTLLLLQILQNLQFYIHGTSQTVQSITDAKGRNSFVYVPNPRGETQLSFDVDIDSADQLVRNKSRHSVTSIYVAGDPEIHSVASSQSECQELPTSNETDTHDQSPDTGNDEAIPPSFSIGGSNVDTDHVASSEILHESVSDGELQPTDSRIDQGLEREEEADVQVSASEISAIDVPISERNFNSSTANRDLADTATANSEYNIKSEPASMVRIASSENKAKNAFCNIVSAKRLAGNQTVTARLHRLESSLSGVLESLRAFDTKKDQAENDQIEKMVSNIAERLGTVEQFLHGFNEDEEKVYAETEQLATEKCDSSTSNVDENNTDGNDQAVDHESSISKDWSDVKPAKTDLEKVPSLLCHLEKRESKTDAALGELAKQILDLQSDLTSRETVSEPTTGVSSDVEIEIRKLSDGLQKQLSDITTSIEGKVSNEDFEKEISSLQQSLERYQEESMRTNQHEADEEVNSCANHELTELREQIADLDKSKMSKDEFDLRMEKKDAYVLSLVEDRITRQNVEIANKTEKISSELNDMRSLVGPQVAVSRSPSEPSSLNDFERVNQSIDLDEMIQQATETVRASLEESLTKRLNELKCIEDELDGLVSQLAEKPSQDQIDSMMRNLEARMSQRIGQDKDLQLIVANMKNGECIALQYFLCLGVAHYTCMSTLIRTIATND
jgi:DNA repair exonuclease SbcCD ATPase subunit